MEYRKLIKFGNSSHVVSLPGEWLKKNNLKKGDILYFEENGNNEIVLSPEKKQERVEEKEISINIEKKSIDTVEREIISAYINNNKRITIIGSNLSKNAERIRELINNLVGLEIIEQTQNRIIANDFVNIRKISIISLIRRIDIIMRAMMSDTILIPIEDLYENIYQRDKDVNRLTILLYRTSRFFFEHDDLSKESSPTDYFKFWTIAENMERIGDEIKRSARFLRKTRIPKRKLEKIINLYKEIEQYYMKVMNAFYKQDRELLFESGIKRDEIMLKVNNFLNENYTIKNVPHLVEKLKNILNFSHSIVKAVIYN